MKFFGDRFDIDHNLKVCMDLENKLMAILTPKDDEIHAAVKINEEGNLVMHPRCNINLVFLGEKHDSIYPNYVVE